MRRLTYAMMTALVESKLAGQNAHTYIVDVRDDDEVRTTGMIPTAVHIPLDKLSSALQGSVVDFETQYGIRKPALDDGVVTYCLKGMRAEKAANVFVEHQYTNVDVYPGSWQEWSEQHHDTTETTATAATTTTTTETTVTEQQQ